MPHQHQHPTPNAPAARGIAPASARAPATPLALRQPADALLLQRRAGNRAVVRSLQRAETGLKEAGATTAFATTSLAFWKDAANRDKPLSDYANHLMTKANAALTTLGSFLVKTDLAGTGAASGAFDRGAWSVSINTAKFSNRAGITKVGQLTLDEAAEVADTIWHEMRHSEQYFRIARMRAGLSTKTTTAEIATELKDGIGIPADVALAAAGAKLVAAAGNAKLMTEAKDWESITLGFHSNYKNNITAWVLEGRDALAISDAVAAGNIADTRAKFGAFVTSWTNDLTRGKFVDSHITATDAIAAKSPLDQIVLRNLRAIKPVLAALQLAWKAVEDNWATDTDAQKLTRLQAVKAPMRNLDAALYAAYRDHLHEKDAWETGAAVGAQFRTLGATP
jgi:hypothetical protein